MVCAARYRFAESHGLGETLASVSVILRRHPDRVVGADVAFILTESLPARRSAEGYLGTMPELIAEVRSRSDWTSEIAAKNEEYFAAHAADGSVQIYRDTDTLVFGQLPAFVVPVADLFAGT